jgi:Cu(I)/Ag(I) efflux system membrane fusion protein/cobalt-zinc-cadmium efflux system membrane fusion protein
MSYETKQTKQHGWLGRVAWLAGGFLLAGLVFADPFHWHSLDDRLRGGSAAAEADGAEESGLWTCGMHPQVIEDHPGTCPICGMNLVPLREGGAAASDGHDHAAASGERELLFYRNPMDPSITSPVPRQDEMGMDYVPVYSDEVDGVPAGNDSGPVVTIDPAVVQNMNVRTEPVTRRTVAREIRTVGYLEYDQQKMVSVTTKYSGFVEKVYVNYKGEPVRKGQPLFEIYSPELVQTEQELLSALDFSRRMGSASEDARSRAESLVQAARQRLSYWDISPQQVARLEETGQVHRALTVSAPASGVVMMRVDGLDGMAIRPGMELFHIADLSSLWLSVEVFEDQLAWVREGSTADVTLSYFPGERFTGRVRYVEPEVSEQTRTVSLRLEVPNRDGKLKSGMYATVDFRPTVAADTVAVPTQAILRTGERNVVIVALGGGRFAPREVTLGSAGEGYVQILEGLSEGEEVVTSAQFLIDSESNLKAAIQAMVAERTAKQAAKAERGN